MRQVYCCEMFARQVAWLGRRSQLITVDCWRRLRTYIVKKSLDTQLSSSGTEVDWILLLQALSSAAMANLALQLNKVIINR